MVTKETGSMGPGFQRGEIVQPLSIITVPETLVTEAEVIKALITHCLLITPVSVVDMRRTLEEFIKDRKL